MLERMWRKGNPSTLLWEYKLVQSLWKTVRRFFTNLKNRTIIWLRNSTRRYISKENETLIQRDVCTPMIMAVLFIIVKIWKQPKSINRWMNKDDVVYIENEYHLAIKRNEIFPFATIWMDLEGIMLNEISQTKED